MAKTSLLVELLGVNHTGAAFKGAGKNANTFAGGLMKIGGLIGGVFAVEKVVEFGKHLVELAEDAEKVDAQLSTSLKNAGSSFEKLEPQIDAADKNLQNFGFTNEDTNTALNTLTIGLGSPAEALKALSVAANLARAKNMDLNSAALLVTKGMEGQIRPLKSLGIDIPVVAGGALKLKTANDQLAKAQKDVNDLLAKTPDAANTASAAHTRYENATYKVQVAQQKLSDTEASGATILKTITARTKDAANAFGETTAGKIATLTAKFQALEVSVGEKLIGPLGRFASFMSNSVLPAATSVYRELSKFPGEKADVVAALGAITAAMVALDAAMDANPIGLVIAALGEMVAISVFVSANFAKIVGPIATTFAAIQGAAQKMVGSVESSFMSMYNNAARTLDNLLGPLNKIRQALGLAIIELPTISFPGKSGSGGGASGASGTKKKIMAASGGIVSPRRGGVDVTVAEAGSKEAIVPLTAKGMHDAGLSGGGGNTYITYNIKALTAKDQNDYAKEHNRTMRNAQQRGAVPV